MLGLVVAAEEQEQLLAVGVEEDAKQNLLLDLEQASAGRFRADDDRLHGIRNVKAK